MSDISKIKRSKKSKEKKIEISNDKEEVVEKFEEKIEEKMEVEQKEEACEIDEELLNKLRQADNVEKYENMAKLLIEEFTDITTVSKLVSLVYSNLNTSIAVSKKSELAINGNGSKLSGREGYTAYHFVADKEVKGKGYLFKSLKRLIDEEAVERIEQIQQTKDLRGFVFDLPSELDDTFQGSWKDGKYDTMQLLENDVPELSDSRNNNTYSDKKSAPVQSDGPSKLTGRDGYTAYHFVADKEVNGKGYLFKSLKRLIDEELVEKIERIQQTKDLKGFVFDLSKEFDSQFQSSWRDGKYDTMQLLDGEIPELSDSNDRPNGRGGDRGGRGGRGRGNDRGGMKRPGSFDRGTNSKLQKFD